MIDLPDSITKLKTLKYHSTIMSKKMTSCKNSKPMDPLFTLDGNGQPQEEKKSDPIQKFI